MKDKLCDFENTSIPFKEKYQIKFILYSRSKNDWRNYVCYPRQAASNSAAKHFFVCVLIFFFNAGENKSASFMNFV